MIERRSPPRTFDQVQIVRRRSSVVLFALLICFYCLAFALIWVVVKFLLSLWMGRVLWMWSWKAVEFLAVFAVALAMALLHWFDAVNNGVRRILSSLGALGPDPKDRYHRTLENVVDELSIASGMGTVEVMVMPVVAMNAFSISDLKGRSVIGVTEGLVSRMTRGQLQAVIAHEIAHLKEGDTILVTMSCSLFGVFSQMLSATASLSKEEPRAFVLYPLIWTITVGAYLLNVLISRQREYLADATAVELNRDPIALAEALYKLGRHWRGERVARPELAPIFIVNPVSSRLDESEGLIADLFSTHPPIRMRIRVLLRMAHTGLGTFAGRLEAESRGKKRGLPEESPEAQPKEQWIAYRDGDWHGPFGAVELMSQSWMAPLTWVARVGSDKVMRARDVGMFLDSLVSRIDQPHGRMKCPACAVWLVQREYEGIFVDACGSCGGMLLEKGQDYRILTREEEVFSSGVRHRAAVFLSENPFRPKRKEASEDENLPSWYPCPSCGRRMMRQTYSYQYFVEVDRCLLCRLTWFDGEELEILQVLVEEARKKSLDEHEKSR